TEKDCKGQQDQKQHSCLIALLNYL
ncbi:uncharacterized protein METZ01_LOCUS387320, partial [marine metagenome]